MEKTYDRHDLPCWDKSCGGTSSCSLFFQPKPHLHCFKCEAQNWNLSEEELEAYRIMDSNLLKLYDKNTESKGNNLKIDRVGLFPQRGIVTSMEDRGITREVAEKFGVERMFNPEDNSPVGYSYPGFVGKDFKAQKIKRLDKKMKWLYEGNGLPDDLGMFGQHLFPAGGKYITITEGEEDAMAAYQMMRADNPTIDPAVVSLFNGASSAEKECKKHWEYINSFENIILAFDGDETGQKAAEKVSRLFNYKPKIMLFGDCKKNSDGVYEFKDANDYLKAGKQKDFIRMWWKAEKVTPKGVKTFRSLWDDMTRVETNVTVPFPWAGLNEKLHGLTTGHFIVVKAPPKVGKTSILKEMIYTTHLTSPYNVGIIFLENTKKEICLGLCALHLNKVIKPWDVPENLEQLAQAHDELSKDDRLTIFDPEDERTVENIINKIMYFVKAHDCRYIFLDHITMMSYQSEDENERKFLDKLCADLKGLTTKLDICLIAVTHVNDDGKTRGSRASVQLCEAMISLERDKTNPDPVIANTTNVVIEENRWGECGLACRLFYDSDTGRMTELDNDLAVNVGEGRTVQFDN